MRLFPTLALVIVLVGAPAARAAVLHVDPDVPDLLATDGACSLREAVINTNDDAATWPDCPAGIGADEIVLHEGTFSGAGLGVGGELSIRGAGAARTILNAQVSVLAQGSLHLSDVSVERVDARTGAIANFGVLVVERVLVRETYVKCSPRSFTCTPFGAAAIFSEGISTEIRDSALLDNVFGIDALRPVSVRNATIAGNLVGVFSDSTASISASTIVDNGIGIGVGTGSATAVSTILALNGRSCTSLLASRGFNLDDDGTCALTETTDLSSTNPLLGPLQDNGGPTPTHALLPGSPAIDAIPAEDCTWDDDGDPLTPEVPVARDQRGVPRPQGACDIGAYEVTGCGDGADNDGDGFIDADDPGCRDAASLREDSQCQDGLNNDPGQDSFIDFDGGLSVLGYVATDPDPQCVGQPWRNKEKRGCGLGFELALLLPLLQRLRSRSGSHGSRGARSARGRRDGSA